MLGTLPLRLRPPGAIPQGQPQLDPRDPINQSALAVWIPGLSGYDLAGLHTPLAYQSGTPRGPTAAGLGMLTSSTEYAQTTVSSGLSGNFGLWACAFRAGSGGLNETILSSDGAVSFWSILGFNGGSSKPTFSLFDGTHNPAVNSSVAVGVGLYTVGGVRNAGQLQVYLNGVLTGTASDTTTGPQVYTTFTLGTQGGGLNTRNMNGTLVIARAWSRPPTASEFSRLQRDPFAALIFPSDFNIGMFGGSSTPVVSPFFVPNFDLRPNIKINPDLRSFIDDRVINLIGSDSIYAGTGQVPSYELKTSPRAPARKDHVKTTDIQLIGQDRIYAGPGQVASYDNNNPVRRKNIEPINWFQNLLQSTLNIIFFPFAQVDWPNPNRRKNDINKTWSDNSKIQLIGQDTFFGAPGQTKVYDYPNPILRKDDITKRTWVATLVYGISATIVLAQQAWNWNKNTYSFIFNYNLAQRAWQWVPNSSIIQYAISLVTKTWQWKGQSPIFSGGNFNKVKRVIQAFMVSINRFMNR